MSDFGESTVYEKTLLPRLTPHIGSERRWESAPTHLPTKRSLAACAFLFGYVAAYIGVGFLGVSLIEHVWSAILR